MTAPTAPTGPSAAARLRGALLEGLLRPGLVSALTALFVAAAPFAVLFGFLDPGFVGSPAAWVLAQDDVDAPLAATIEILEAERPDPARERVYIVGASSTRHLVNGPLLQATFESLGARAAEVVKSTVPATSALESAAIVDRIAEHSQGGAVVIGVNVRSLARDPSDNERHVRVQRVGFRSGLIDDAVRDAGGRPFPVTGNWFWDNRSFYLTRVLPCARNLVAGPVPKVSEAPLRGRKPQRGRAAEGQFAAYRERLLTYESCRDVNVGYLERAARRAQTSGRVRVVFLLVRENPAFLEWAGLQAAAEDCARRVADLAARTGAGFLDLVPRAEIATTDFYDAQHVCSPEAADRHTKILAEELVRIGAVTADAR